MSITEWLVVLFVPAGWEKKKTKLPAMETAEREQAKNADSLTPRPAPVAEEQYVGDCLRPTYQELPETRSWNSDPAFQKVLGPLNSGHNDVACREAEALVAQFRDFSSLYVWWGAALLRMGSLDKARRVLRDGLERAREKYLLCNRLGDVEWKARDLRTAVYWWAQGLHCQESLSESGYGGHEGTYLCLHYVAEGLRLSECPKAFLARVDSIRPGMIRLDAETANDLTSLARSARDQSIERVVEALVRVYMTPPTTPSAKVDTEELDRLIRQLEEVASCSRFETGSDINAINRLAELGDQKAIAVLMRIAPLGGVFTADGWADVGSAAKKAIDKIQAANP